VASATLFHQDPLPKLATVVIGGAHFDMQKKRSPAQEAALQRAMKKAKDLFGSALCVCGARPQKLQIKLRNDKFHLAVWPEHGHLHNFNCMFYRDETQSDMALEAHADVKEKDSGERVLRLNFSLDGSFHAIERPAAMGRGQPKGAISNLNKPALPGRGPMVRAPAKAPAIQAQAYKGAPTTQTTLRALLHLLWDESNMTRWHPAWNRDWGRVRYELMQAAQRVRINDHDLQERLYVPKVYRPNQKDELNLDWEHFVRNLSIVRDLVNKGAFMIGVARKLVTLPDGSAALHLRHLNHPIGIGYEALGFIRNNCKPAVRRLTAISQPAVKEEGQTGNWVDVPQPDVLVIAHVHANSQGGIWARGLWLMMIHPNVFIPANSPDEILLVNALLQQGHQFKRNLSLETAMYRKHPDWILQHVYDPKGEPVDQAALEVSFNGAIEEFLERRAKLADGLAAQGVPTWTWTPKGAQHLRKPPMLPPSSRLSHKEGRAVLESIERAQSLYYGYGAKRDAPNL